MSEAGSLWGGFCQTCGRADVSRSSASRSSSRFGAAQHIEAWRGIKPPKDTEPHGGMFDNCASDKCSEVRALLARLTPGPTPANDDGERLRP